MTDVLASFGKFSVRAKTVLLAAQRYAEAMHTGFGSEHLLMAVMVTPDTNAYQLLRKIPITPDQLRLALAMNPPKPTIGTDMRDETKSILERAAFQAAILGTSQIEPEFILWSLISDAHCAAYQLVKQLGVEPKSIRKSLEQQFAESSGLDNLPHDIEILGVVGPDPHADRTHPLHDHAHVDHEHIGEPAVVNDEEDESATPVLDEFTIDLTALAAEHAFDPLIGRELELERVMHVLGRKAKNNPVLIGEPGVGKTAIIEGLAQRILRHAVPAYLQGTRLLSLEMGGLIAGTMYRGQFEERLRRLVAELQSQDDTILFIDEIHTLVGAGSAEGALDAANILKPILVKGTLRIVGATTQNEYQRYIEKDAALARRLQPVMVQEPSEAETLTILKGLAPRYAEFHGVTITPELLQEIVSLAGRYLHERHFPDKAIDLLDEAAAARKAARPTRTTTRRSSRFELERSLKELRSQKTSELKRGNFERAAYLRTLEGKLKLEASRFQAKKIQSQGKRLALTTDDVRMIVSRWIGVPAERLQLRDRRSLLSLEERLGARVIGQRGPIETLAATVRRARAGLRSPKRPMGAFLLVGPTGVGKTETARAIAEEAFGDDRALLKIDMSEYMEKHQVARFLGAPPGYVGHEQASPILEDIRRRPHRVLLLDEIEKAHPDVINVLLQLLEDGVLTDGKGRTVSFRETLVLMTSNVGGDLWSQPSPLGFTTPGQSAAWWESPLQEQLKNRFRPEFLNRLDGVLTYHPLERVDLERILDRELVQFIERIKATGLTLTLTERLHAFLLRRVVASNQGARTVRRLVETDVATKLADGLLRWPGTRHVTIDIIRDSIVVHRTTLQETRDAKSSAVRAA